MQTLIPIFLLIGLGAGMRHYSFPGAEFWAPATRITYYLFLPALLISKVATARFSGRETLLIAIVVVVSVGLITLFILGSNRWMAFPGPALTSVLQGGIRVNTYVGLATAAALLGNEGLAMSGLVHAIWVLTVNVICVAALVVYGGEGIGNRKRGLGREEQLNRQEQVGFGIVVSSLVALGRNPMIVACCVGLFINAIGWNMPAWLASGLVILGQAGLPLGLLLVGAGLRVRNLSGAGRAVAVASLVKLLLLPLVIWGLATILPIGSLGVAVLVLVASLPSATSSYVLALEMGGDAELMAGILTVETVLAAVTMPIVLGAIGL